MGGKECCSNVSSRLWGGALRDDTKNGCEGVYQLVNFGETPGGVLEVYMTGGSDGASYCKPKKIHKPEILDPKNTWHQNFQPKKIQDINTSILSDRNENPKRKVRSEIRPQKYAYFFNT